MTTPARKFLPSCCLSQDKCHPSRTGPGLVAKVSSYTAGKYKLSRRRVLVHGPFDGGTHLGNLLPLV